MTMLKENKVCFSELQGCLMHYEKVLLTYHTSIKQNLNILLSCLVFYFYMLKIFRYKKKKIKNACLIISELYRI